MSAAIPGDSPEASVFAAIFLSILFSPPPQPAGDAPVKYLRPSGDKFVMECVFSPTKTDSRVMISSTTERGKTKLVVLSTYGDKDVLIDATVSLYAKGETPKAQVRVKEGKATIERPGKDPESFDVPPGVIVTSAPDWTDAWMLCRRFDRTKKGKQEFPGLWIHPVEPAQRLTFAIERQGADTIEHKGEKQELDRHMIWLRGKSSYAVWADAKGQMIKLVPLPYKKDASNWIVLEGYEKSAAKLTP
jgi:hypothetical protein